MDCAREWSSSMKFLSVEDTKKGNDRGQHYRGVATIEAQRKESGEVGVNSDYKLSLREYLRISQG